MEDQLSGYLEKFEQFGITDFYADEGTALSVRTSNHQLLKQEIAYSRKQHGLLKVLASNIDNWLERSDLVVICCRSAQRCKNLAELLSRFDFSFELLTPPLDLDRLEPQGGALHLSLRIPASKRLQSGRETAAF